MTEQTNFEISLDDLKKDKLVELTDRPLSFYFLKGRGQHEPTTRKEIVRKMEANGYDTMIAWKVDTGIAPDLSIIVESFE